MSVEILMHIQVYTPVKASLFLKGIQQFGLIINQMNKRNSSFRTDILSKTGILMKITKNLLGIASSPRTKYLILKKNYMDVRIK